MMPQRKKRKISHTERTPQADKVPSQSLGTPVLTCQPNPLSGLPNETIFTIARYLRAADLYNLSKTCKDMRARLWSKRAESEWKVAIRNAGRSLPAKPPFLSIPAFVNLLFSSHCNVCGRFMRKILDGCFVRICKACLPDVTVWYGLAAKQIRTLNADLSDIILDPKTLSTYFIVLESSNAKANRRRNLLLKCDVDRVLKRFEALHAPVSKEALDAFASTLNAECRSRETHGQAIEEWFEERRGWEATEGKKRRFEQILARLREEGWGEELRSMSNWALEDMSDLPHVRQSKSLTEGDWPKVMRSLKGILDARRESLIADRYRMCVRRRFKVLEAAIVAHCVQLPRTPSMLCHPTPLDLALMPECRAILERPLSDAVVQDDLKPLVPALVERWETDVRSKLTDYLVRHMGQVAPGVDPLTLAIGVFTCSVRCVDDRMDLPMPAGAMQYPAVLHHACLRRGRRAFPSEEDDLLARTIMRLDLTAAGIRAHERMHGASSYCDVPFDVGMLEQGPAAPAAIGRMRRIVSALGLDPACATIGELKTCTSRLYCRRCHASKVHRPNVHIHDWQSAFAHEDRHFGPITEDADAEGLWQRVTDPESRAHSQEAEASEHPLFIDRYSSWCCSLCTEDPMDKWNVPEHLLSRHGIKNAAEAIRDGTMFRHPWLFPEMGRCRSFGLVP